MEQNTLKIYYIGRSTHPSLKRLVLERVEIGTSNVYRFNIDSANWVEDKNPLAQGSGVTCTTPDEFDGMPCFSTIISVDNKEKFKRLKDFLRLHQQVSCPDSLGNESNEYISRYPNQKKFVMVDMREKVEEEYNHQMNITNARSMVLEMFQERKQEMYELSWEVGVVPLAKDIEQVFIEMCKICDTAPNKILYISRNDLAIMDRYCRKAQYLKNDGVVILSKSDYLNNYTYCLEPNNSFASVEGFREYICASPEREMNFKRIVDKADTNGYNWGLGEVDKKEIKNITNAIDEDAKKSFESSQVNSSKRTLKEYGEDLDKILKSKYAVSLKQTKTKEIVSKMLRDYGMEQSHIKCDDIAVKNKLAPQEFNLYFNINKEVTA